MDLDSNRKLIAIALAATAAGDRNALQTVYRLTATKLFAVCLRILGERSEAEDVLQEVYMTVWRKAAIFRLGVILDRSVGNQKQLEAVELTATRLGQKVSPVLIDDAGGILRTIDHVQTDTTDALIFESSPIFTANAREITQHVGRLGLPAIYESRVLVKSGGLISYGPNLNEMFRRVAYYVDRIIKGTKPTELPIERPTKFELFVNVRTAKELGLNVPPTLLARADEVIE